MTELMRRRRALMGIKSADDHYLYKDGVVSPVLGGFNTTGYKYGTDSNFTQEIESNALYIASIVWINNPGGRTFTSDNPLPSGYAGKTLHIKGVVGVSGTVKGGRSFIYAFVSDAVSDDSASANPEESTAFTNPIFAKYSTGNMNAGASKEFEITLPLTKSGYLSLVMNKAYSGELYTRFKEVWAE